MLEYIRIRLAVGLRFKTEAFRLQLNSEPISHTNIDIDGFEDHHVKGDESTTDKRGLNRGQHNRRNWRTTLSAP